MMHYYQFNIADYRKDTMHLSRLEHGIYRDLIDWYYLDEKPIPLETQVVRRRLRLDTEEEAKALNNVLSDFFSKADGWHHDRIDQDIRDYHAMADKNKANGKLGGRPKKTQSVTSGLPDETESKPTRNPNQEPRTNNHKPIKSKADALATRLPADWKPDEVGLAFCKAERPDLQADSVADRFRDYWTAQPGAKGRKTDWPATWRNWVRNENAPKVVAQKQTADSPKPGDKAVINGKELTYYAGLGFAL